MLGISTPVYHDEQRCLCKLYNHENECYMIAGLQGERLLTANAAKKVYDCIMRNRGANELLITAYSRLREKYPWKKKKKTSAEKKRGRGKVIRSDDEVEECKELELSDVKGMPVKSKNVTRSPLPCKVNHKKVRRDWWTTAIDKPYYEAANKHCVDLKL